MRAAVQSLGREIVLRYRTLDQLHDNAVLLAAYFPGRRASRVQPMDVLSS